jgi:type II secretory pathway predicted ATPase ExeA
MQGSGDPKPFFLGLAQHAELLAFAQPYALSGPRLLALTGPVKCGKTTVLRKVLPALIAQEHSRSGLPDARPFIVKFTFTFKSSSAKAAHQLEGALCDAVAGLGVEIFRHDVAEQALKQLSTTVERAGQAVRETGRSLWLLVDECQVTSSVLNLAVCFKLYLFCRSALANPFHRHA